MSVDRSSKNVQLPIRNDLTAGIDVGGTKVHIMDTIGTSIRRYNTSEYSSLDDILDDYFISIGARPTKIAIGMAGARDDETGEIKLTNSHWAAFKPIEAMEKYGIEITTANDMVSTTAGVLEETGIDLLVLKSGTPSPIGTKVVVSLSTGIGAAAAVWDSHSSRYVIVAGEGGHIGFQPKTEEEQEYLKYLHKKYPHASVELALSGKHGIDNMVDHSLETHHAPALKDAIERARVSNRPVGAVLLEIADQGNGIDREVSQHILRKMGAMLGSALRDLTLVYKATGGVYLTGSVAMALGEYLAENTDLKTRFVHVGAVHDNWLEKVPVSLVMDPNVAAVGALSLAKKL